MSYTVRSHDTLSFLTIFNFDIFLDIWIEQEGSQVQARWLQC